MFGKEFDVIRTICSFCRWCGGLSGDHPPQYLACSSFHNKGIALRRFFVSVGIRAGDNSMTPCLASGNAVAGRAG